MSLIFKSGKPGAYSALLTLEKAKKRPRYAAALTDALTWLKGRDADQVRIEKRLVRGGYTAQEATALVDPIWNPTA